MAVIHGSYSRRLVGESAVYLHKILIFHVDQLESLNLEFEVSKSNIVVTGRSQNEGDLKDYTWYLKLTKLTYISYCFLALYFSNNN